jgi:hypothetical protein
MILFVGSHHEIREALSHAIEEETAVFALRRLGRLRKLLSRNKTINTNSSKKAFRITKSAYLWQHILPNHTPDNRRGVGRMRDGLRLRRNLQQPKQIFLERPCLSVNLLE